MALGCLNDGTEVEIDLSSQTAHIVTRGSQAAIVELCELFAWLGAALRTSPISSGICVVTPSIKDAHFSDITSSITARIAFTTNSQDRDSPDVKCTCWHAMFRNPVVVDGFPILARHENEHGLEMPIDMLCTLAETHFATRYDATLVLKGVCTMLVPTQQTDRSITWHFMFNEDGERIPYYAFRQRCPTWIGVDKVSIERLEHQRLRNFVGWVSNITRHFGKFLRSVLF